MDNALAAWLEADQYARDRLSGFAEQSRSSRRPCPHEEDDLIGAVAARMKGLLRMLSPSAEEDR